mgnify:CR=1 FL=1
MARWLIMAAELLAEAGYPNGEGLPHARLLPLLGPLFACWTRARWIGGRLGGGPWSRGADSQYQWLVRHVIRLNHRTRHDAADFDAWPREAEHITLKRR